MSNSKQFKARAVAARKGFKTADLAVFGALVIAGLLVAVGIAHSGTETVAVKTDRLAIATTPVSTEDMVTISHTDETTRTTTLIRSQRDPSFGYGL